jgi:PD-(D/E)XK nuclease superfamily
MTAGPTFSLTRNGVPITTLALGEAEVTGAEPAPVNELQPCSFLVEGRDAGQEYRVWIGDRDPEPGEGAPAPRPVGLARGSAVVWDEAVHFDGARGRVWVRLASRPIGSGQAWAPRAQLPVYVNATKLSEDRYHVMVAQLRALAAGLVFDLYSKMFRSLQFAESAGAVSSRSSQVELRLLERLWASLAPALQEVAADPVTQISVSRGVRPSWGGERLGQRTVARLAAEGLDPRRPGAPRPFRAYTERFTEVPKTLEHAIILGLLRFLEQRAADCARGVRSHVEGIEADRPLRQRGPAGTQSLYQTEDLPRLRRLRTSLAQAERLRQRIRAAQGAGPWRGMQPLFRFPVTPVFEHVRPYRLIRDEVRRYLRSNLLVVDDGLEERIKSTSRLYEQWVFFQLAAAFRRAGLRCQEDSGVLRRSRLYRFTLEMDRGARLLFLAADGRAVGLRFEPWVAPLRAGGDIAEDYCHGMFGEAAWSPDVLIEFLDGPEPGAAVQYVVIVDAKYTARIREHHWADTSKYLHIRATRTRRQVVKQLWLAWPDERAGILPRDAAVRWTPDGPDCPYDETVQGVLAAVPPVELPEDTGEEEGWISTPVPVVLAFVEGLLNYLEVPRG